jgi:hypothetical protein
MLNPVPLRRGLWHTLLASAHAPYRSFDVRRARHGPGRGLDRPPGATPRGCGTRSGG